MTEYDFVPDPWNDLFNISGSAKSEERLPIALEMETAYVFRDSTGEVVHRYPFSDQHFDVSFLRHYLHYISQTSYRYFSTSSVKHRLFSMIEMCLQKVASRNRTTFFEIGATIGENYRLLQSLRQEIVPDMELEFVGFELSPNLSQFARIANTNDPAFQMIVGDASDLSRFPDRCFDFVLNQGVANFVDNPTQAFGEILRVARVATLVGMQLTTEDEPFYLTRDIGYCTMLPTRELLEDVWRKHGPIYDYPIWALPWEQLESSGSGSDRFVGVDPKEIHSVFEYHILAREPIFPELNSICNIIR
jgi:SAM-dependent methyltransferase